MPETLPLWNGTPPGWNPADDRSPPVLEWDPHPQGGIRPCGVVCPGGGYFRHAEHEDAPFRAWFHERGFHAATLRYRTQFTNRPKPLGRGPLSDAERALELLRERATIWGIEPGSIAVMGFSAGAHVAGSLAVHGRSGCRPNAVVLCYGVLVTGAHAHLGSVENLCGKDDEENLRGFFDLPSHVNGETPPAFLWHTAEDQAVPVENSLAMAAALARHRVPHALHVFPHGSHGIGMASETPLASAWPELCAAWLDDWRAHRARA